MVYFHAPGRAGENAETFLTGFDAILQIDGYQGYNRLTKMTRRGGRSHSRGHCWAHARRKLKEGFDRDGSEIAAEGLHRITEIYTVEADIRGVSSGQRLSGLVTVTFRSPNSFMRPFAQMRRGFCRLATSGGAADCRSR